MALIDKILNLTKQLYPPARAWQIAKDSYYETLHYALAESEKTAVEASKGLLNSILPDNANFSETDASNWESALGLFHNSELTLEERKQMILRKMQHPGNQKPRQHFKYIENELRKAGFDVYVHENRFPSSDTYIVADVTPAIYGVPVLYGNIIYANEGFLNMETVANNIDYLQEVSFVIGSKMNYKATFFIGGAIYPDTATVPRSRRNEFRDLILRMKPAHTVAILLIDYDLNFIFEDGDNFILENGDNFVLL